MGSDSSFESMIPSHLAVIGCALSANRISKDFNRVRAREDRSFFHLHATLLCVKASVLFFFPLAFAVTHYLPDEIESVNCRAS